MTAEYHTTVCGTRSPTSSSLSERHWQTLVDGSAIAPKIVEESGARTIEQGSELPDVFSERQRRRGAGIIFTCHRPNGSTSPIFRPDRPRADKPGHKYEAPCKALGGAGNCLDILPSQHPLMEDTGAPLVFCEGSKKMMSFVTAAREAGVTVCVVSIIGIWNFLHNGGEIIPDMWDIPVKGRRVTIAFDSDMVRKPEVALAAKRLAEHLQGRGATVFIIYLPDLPDGSKCGVDDFFVQGHTFADLRDLTWPYREEDFQVVRLSRDERLRAMLDSLAEIYAAMPASRQGQCADRATMRWAIAEGAASGVVHRSELGAGIMVRLPVRPLSLKTRMSRGAQANSLHRLERDGYIAPVEEPDHVIAERGRAYVLKARALGGHYGERPPTERKFPKESDANQQSNECAQEKEKTDRYADLCGGVHVARALSGEVPELRAAKVVHSWGRKDGERVVLFSEYFYRLGKPRWEILAYLLDAGGAVHEDELLARFGSKTTRRRDFRKRRLAPLQGWRFRSDGERVATGPPIIEVDEDGMVSLLPEWRESLEHHRQSTAEDGDHERQKEAYAKNRRKYRERDRAPADEQQHPLLGKERNRRNARARAAEERTRWAERERQMVGVSAADFLADEADDDGGHHGHGGYGGYGPRVQDAIERWRLLHGGSQAQIWAAVKYGPFVLRKKIYGEAYSETYIDPLPRVADPPPEPERKLPAKDAHGIYHHTAGCACWLCADSEPAQGVA